MKNILIALLLFISSSAFSQQAQIIISTNNNSLQISPDSNNINKLFVINNAIFSDKDYLTIKVNSESDKKEFNRKFFIYDSSNIAIKDFVLMSDGTYCLKLNDVSKLLLPQKEYFIYTTAIPKDVKKAMLVKMAKRLVCKIKIL
ncbi:MAG: hypothetical protein ABJB05_05515 [Parafilimonas sp.]